MVSWFNKKRSAPHHTHSSAPTQFIPLQQLQPLVPQAGSLITFTPAAHAQMLEVLNSRGITEQGAVRLTVQNPGAGDPTYGMALEEVLDPQTCDTVVDVGGFRVVVDDASLPEVTGATVDFVDDPLRPGFRVDPPRPEPIVPAARPSLDLSDPVVQRIATVIDQQVNPSIAAHGGRATLIDVKDDTAYVELGGRCQGCSMASVTLKQGVEQLICSVAPQIKRVLDVTDHAGGSNPYYAGSKGGASPFVQAAKS